MKEEAGGRGGSSDGLQPTSFLLLIAMPGAPLVAPLLLVAMPFATSSVLLLPAMEASGIKSVDLDRKRKPVENRKTLSCRPT